MAQTSHIKLNLRADTRLARLVGCALYPAVLLGLLSVGQAVAIAMNFVRIRVAEA